jgi:hypothetical protein
VKVEGEELDSPVVSFAALSSLLGSAARLARDLSRDLQLQRLLRVFLKLPAADRPVVLATLEREVAAREASVRAQDGVVGPVDLVASVYIRVFDAERDALGVTRDDVVRSSIDATVYKAGLPASLAAELEDSLAIALDSLPDDEAFAMADMYDDLLAVLAECER